ncbi:MAG TPA: cupin domain-containing protein [Acidimicrobiales bacterium]|nr:cupin domain-containing protein [Acidimicrobiales bacterium]
MRDGLSHEYNVFTVNAGSTTRTGAVALRDVSRIGVDIAEVGAALRAARTAQGLSLRVVANRSGLSYGYLSQVERGISSVGLTSLASIARALGMELKDLLPSSVDPAQLAGREEFCWVQRAGSPAPTVQSGDRYYRLLSSHADGIVLEPMLVRIHPGEDWESPVSHAGEEFAYVLEGELVVTVGRARHHLHAGDSIHLRSEQPHHIHNPADRVVTVVSVVTPRLF